MKKAYIHPDIRVVKLDSTTSILAGSGTPQWNPDDTAGFNNYYDEDEEFL